MQLQQMWQAAAAGGSSRQDSKQACISVEMRSYLSACTCVHAKTHDMTLNRPGGACLSQSTCHPYYKNRPMHTKSRGQTCTQKCLVLDRPDKISTHGMHKHANKTRTGAGHSDDACHWLYAPTHASALERAFPAQWHAFLAHQ